MNATPESSSSLATHLAQGQPKDWATAVANGVTILVA